VQDSPSRPHGRDGLSCHGDVKDRDIQHAHVCVQDTEGDALGSGGSAGVEGLPGAQGPAASLGGKRSEAKWGSQVVATPQRRRVLQSTLTRRTWRNTRKHCRVGHVRA
jgi:hypothetical protein